MTTWQLFKSYIPSPMSTKLLNSTEPIPDIFFVFVTMDNLITKHNLEVAKSFSSGAFVQLVDNFEKKYVAGSVDYLPFVINTNSDMKMVSPFYNSVTSEYRTEYNCEIHRRHNFPTYPSRLSAFYAFGDYGTCKLVSEKYNWDIKSVKKFRLEPSVHNRVVKVNMEIVSLERYANRVSMIDSETQKTIWQSYWTGHGDFSMELPTLKGRQTFNSETIWEYLVEGRLTLIED
jgi:hypothetical protein